MMITVNYYDDDGATLIESVNACVGQIVKFKTIEKEGYTFKGWDFLTKSEGKAVFASGAQESFNDASLTRIRADYQGFNLIPV